MPDLEFSATRGNFGERQTASIRDWGYYAHLSIYDFAMQFAPGKRVLDVGSGTGYGTNYLAKFGSPASLLGLERDTDLVEYLSRTFPHIMFQQCDLNNGKLPPTDKSLDVIFTSNVLEHIAYIDPVLEEFRRVLVEDGIAIVAIPPIPGPFSLKENAKNIFHINNLPHPVWQSKLSRFFFHVEAIRHWVVPEKSKGRSAIETSMISSVCDFTFLPCVDPRDHDETVTAIYVCRRPRQYSLGLDTEQKIPASWQHLRVEAEGRQEAFIELNRQIQQQKDAWKGELNDAIAWASEAINATPAAQVLTALLAHLRMLANR